MNDMKLDLNDVDPQGVERPHFDRDAIIDGLRSAAEHWVPRLFPNGRRVGDEWRLANIRGDAPRNTGSCAITLKGSHAGGWIDFDGNRGGGPISTVEEATGLSGWELIARAAEIAGVKPGAPKRQAPPISTSSKRNPSLKIDHILDTAMPAADTLVAEYLRQRGLLLPEGADILYSPNLTHWDSKTGYPGMIGVVRDRDGEVIGLHRTYLDAAANEVVTKALISKPKMMLGRISGGAVRLGNMDDDEQLALTEGIETGLAVRTACPHMQVWATLSTSGLEQVQLPTSVRRVLILADHDASEAGARAAEAAAQRLRAEGREVIITMPPAPGEDFNDVLLREGPDAVANAIAEAGRCAEAGATLQLGQHRPLNFLGTDGNLPILRADEGDLASAVEQVWKLIQSSNRTPWMFRLAGQLTWIVSDDEGRPVAETINEQRLRYMLAQLANWKRMNGKGELVAAPPPLPVVKSVLATPDPALPVLVGIVNTPVFGRSGILLTKPGYHPDARLFYQPAPAFKVSPVSPRPTEDEVAAARTLICEDLLGDFPFVGPAERAHVLALLLLGFLRGMIDGPTPLHLIEKPTPGTGATLMVDAMATILTGAGASVMTEGRDDDEWRKRLTAKLSNIPSMVLIDNVRRNLDSSALAAALTGSFWEDRILGASEMTRLPIRCLWIATGNNPELSNEMARRVVRIRLDANVERPWQREGFRHPDLMIWVRANRANLVAACLTLCQAWIAAGRPYGRKTIGSFENWAQVMGGVLEVAGIDGFLGNLEEMMESSDGEGAAWNGFVTAWWEQFGTSEVGASDLFEIAMLCDPAPPVSGHTVHAQKTRFGIAIRQVRDRVFNIQGLKLRIVKDGVAHKATRWKLKVCTERSEHAGWKQHKSGEPLVSEGNLKNGGSPDQSIENIERGERGEPWEPHSAPMRTCTLAHDQGNSGKGSSGSRASQNHTNSNSSAGEPPGEPLTGGSRGSPVPAWLQELDE